MPRDVSNVCATAVTVDDVDEVDAPVEEVDATAVVAGGSPPLDDAEEVDVVSPSGGELPEAVLNGFENPRRMGAAQITRPNRRRCCGVSWRG